MAANMDANPQISSSQTEGNALVNASESQIAIECASKALSATIMDGSSARMSQKETAFNLRGLPKDIMLSIIELLLAGGDITTATSLGLTCRSFYNILKSLHPKPILLVNLNFPNHPLSRRELSDLEKEPGVVNAVREFLGHQYRGTWILRERRYYFLNKYVYGEENGIAERRFLDSMAECWALKKFLERRDLLITTMPHPIGKGDD